MGDGDVALHTEADETDDRAGRYRGSHVNGGHAGPAGDRQLEHLQRAENDGDDAG